MDNAVIEMKEPLTGGLTKVGNELSPNIWVKTEVSLDFGQITPLKAGLSTGEV